MPPKQYFTPLQASKHELSLIVRHRILWFTAIEAAFMLLIMVAVGVGRLFPLPASCSCCQACFPLCVMQYARGQFSTNDRLTATVPGMSISYTNYLVVKLVWDFLVRAPHSVM